MHPKVRLDSGQYQIDVTVTNLCIEALIDVAETLVQPLDILMQACVLPILAGTYGKPQLQTKTEKTEFSNCQVSGKSMVLVHLLSYQNNI